MDRKTEIIADALANRVIELEQFVQKIENQYSALFQKVGKYSNSINEQINKRISVQESLDAALRENEDLKNDAVELGKIIDEKNDRIKELEDIVKSPIPCRTCQSKCIVSNCLKRT